MEKRLLFAIVLSFLVIFLYQAVFMKRPPQPETPKGDTPLELTQAPEPKAEPEPIESQPAKKQPQAAQESPPSQADFTPTSEQAEEQIVIDTAMFQAVWSNKGGVLRSWRLREHKDDGGEDLELVSTQSQEINRYPFSLLTEDPDFDTLINNSLYKSARQTKTIDGIYVEEVRFDFADEHNNRVEKIFVFYDGMYNIDLAINVWRNGQQIEPRIIWGPQIGNPDPAAKKTRFGGSTGISVYSAAKVHRHEEKKYTLEKSTYNFVNWAAYDDQYFTALFITMPQKTSAVFIREEVNQIPYYFLAVNYAQKAYIGPKSYETLSQFGHNAKKIVKFGLFGFIAEILYSAIKAIHKAVPNWGFSIIILTLLIKIIFFPLTYSSTKSMAKMQELQPKIKALKAKYKKAKQDIEQRRKMNEETMRLYKEHGVNPAGGCLPMLIQLPIFWGFFRLLVVAIEFRHSPFILWLNDLSVKDPYYITPILMGISQFISQKITPTSGDATQQKMMLIMPVIMTIFFMNFQSGLVLYWLTNNVLQIGQQLIMNHFRQKKKRESHGKRRKK